VEICNFKHLEHAIDLDLYIQKDNTEIVGCTSIEPKIVDKNMQISMTTIMPK